MTFYIYEPSRIISSHYQQGKLVSSSISDVSPGTIMFDTEVSEKLGKEDPKYIKLSLMVEVAVQALDNLVSEQMSYIADTNNGGDARFFITIGKKGETEADYKQLCEKFESARKILLSKGFIQYRRQYDSNGNRINWDDVPVKKDNIPVKKDDLSDTCKIQ